MSRGEKAVRITLEFRGPDLCFDDAHGDYGPSALTAVERVLRGMVEALLEHKMLAIMAHPKTLAKIPKHHTRKRRECVRLHERVMAIYDQEQAMVEAALKTARFDVVTNWNWDES